MHTRVFIFYFILISPIHSHAGAMGARKDGKIKVAETLNRANQDVYELELVIEDSAGVTTRDRVVIFVQEPRDGSEFND